MRIVGPIDGGHLEADLREGDMNDLGAIYIAKTELPLFVGGHIFLLRVAEGPYLIALHAASQVAFV